MRCHFVVLLISSTLLYTTALPFDFHHRPPHTFPPPPVTEEADVGPFTLPPMTPPPPHGYHTMGQEFETIKPFSDAAAVKDFTFPPPPSTAVPPAALHRTLFPRSTLPPLPTFPPLAKAFRHRTTTMPPAIFTADDVQLFTFPPGHSDSPSQ